MPAKKKTKKSSAKKPVRKAKKVTRKVKKVVKKKAKTTKKRVLKAKSSSTQVHLCPICRSPHISSNLKAKKVDYSCNRCGYHGHNILKTNLKEARSVVANRRSHVETYYNTRNSIRVSRFDNFLKKIHFRMWLGLISMILLVFGVVLISSKESFLGLLLTVFGLLGAFLAEKS